MKYLFLVIVTFFCTSTRANEKDEFFFKLPSSVTVGGGSSSTGTKSGSIDARILLPRNYWIGATADHSTETIDGLETKTTGAGISVGTDPIRDYGVEIGYDKHGIEDQYRVDEVHIRVSGMPETLLGADNPGFEAAVEFRSSRFGFANSPNIIFASSVVELDARSVRLDFAFYGWIPWHFRVWSEKSSIDDRFRDLARPLAPLFVPVAAISEATNWPAEEFGLGVGFGRKRWSLQATVTSKTAAVSGDRTGIMAASGDFKWTRSIISTLRFSHSVSQQAPTSATNSIEVDPIQSYGLDLTFYF